MVISILHFKHINKSIYLRFVFFMLYEMFFLVWFADFLPSNIDFIKEKTKVKWEFPVVLQDRKKQHKQSNSLESKFVSLFSLNPKKSYCGCCFSAETICMDFIFRSAAVNDKISFILV